MRIYLSHSTAFDYASELYEPLRSVPSLAKMIYFPHSPENNGKYSKDVVLGSDVVLAEVSYPSTGQGIELGWADSIEVPIICFHLAAVKPSSSLALIAQEVIEYSNQAELIEKLAKLDKFKQI